MERGDCTVHLATNYPKSIVRNRFQCLPDKIYTNVAHGIFSRVVNRLGPAVDQRMEPVVLPAFGRFALRCAQSDNYDLVHSFTGVAEEVLKYKIVECVNTVVRGSSHILTQYGLMQEEEARLVGQ